MLEGLRVYLIDPPDPRTGGDPRSSAPTTPQRSPLDIGLPSPPSTARKDDSTARLAEKEMGRSGSGQLQKRKRHEGPVEPYSSPRTIDLTTSADAKARQPRHGRGRLSRRRRRLNRGPAESNPKVIDLATPADPKPQDEGPVNPSEVRSTESTELHRPRFRLPPGWSPSPSAEQKASMREAEEKLSAPVGEHVDYIGPETRCPICNAVVDYDMHHLHFGDRPGTLDHALDFCDLHQMAWAEREWQELGYPTIDWTDLERRILALLQPARDILSGSVHSVCVERLSLVLGRIRKHNALLGSLREPSSALSSGYYGPRGADQLRKLLVSHLAPDIRRYSFAGIGLELSFSGIVEAILVPELTLLLIQEDMHCDEPRALLVLEQSQKIGLLIHPETKYADVQSRLL